jgi:hypothetical protein
VGAEGRPAGAVFVARPSVRCLGVFCEHEQCSLSRIVQGQLVYRCMNRNLACARLRESCDMSCCSSQLIYECTNRTRARTTLWEWT